MSRTVIPGTLGLRLLPEEVSVSKLLLLPRWGFIGPVVLILTLFLAGCGLVGGGDEGEGDATAEAASSEDGGSAKSGGSGGSSAESDFAKRQVETLESEIASLKEELTKAREAASSAPDVGEIEAKIRADIEAEVRAEVQKDVNRISLERARLVVVQHAGQNRDVYGTYASEALVWEVASAEEQEEFFYVKLNYKPFGRFDGTPGLEEFIVEKDGTITFRQVLSEPDSTKKSTPEPPPAPTPDA